MYLKDKLSIQPYVACDFRVMGLPMTFLLPQDSSSKSNISKNLHAQNEHGVFFGARFP